jgi:membrane protein YdbS with pleckstrin-like domain
MMRHSRLRLRASVLLAALVLLLTGHAVVLYFSSSHAALPASIVVFVIVLIAIKHLGLLGATYGLLRRRVRRQKQRSRAAPLADE